MTLNWLACCCLLAVGAVAAAPDATPDARARVIRDPQWHVTREDEFVRAEGPVLGLRFAYVPADKRGAGGWFKGGGGRDGSICEFYFKPTSPTRNLVPRNGAWGGKKEAMDLWEAEPAAEDGADHNAPDFSTPHDARLTGHRVYESAGRLIAEAEFDFETWRIRRTHIVYPWGDITVHARLEHAAEARWNYLGHRFEFAVKPYRTQNAQGETFDWGGHYQSDGESYYAWSDLRRADGRPVEGEPYLYQETISEDLNKNTAVSMAQRQDPYSGFMLDDANGNDPDILVMNGDASTAESPFVRISERIGGRNYVETGIFTPFYSKQRHTYAGCCWFYATIPCCPPVYDRPMLWPADLGPWEESFHVMLRQGIEPGDYFALWRARSRDVAEQAPTQVRGAAVRLDAVDRLYHLIAQTGADEVAFTWRRHSAAGRPIDHRQAFVVEGLGPVGECALSGPEGVRLEVYEDPERDVALLVLTGEQPAEPVEMQVRVRRQAQD